MGLYGVLVVTMSTTRRRRVPTPRGYGATFDKDVPLLLSEIDPAQNSAVDTAVRTAGFTETQGVERADRRVRRPGAPVVQDVLSAGGQLQPAATT